MTFYVKTDEPEFTAALINELKYHKYNEDELPVDFVFLSGKAAYWKNQINLKNSLLTNMVKDEPLTNKIELHTLFANEKFIKSFTTIVLTKNWEEKIKEFSTIKIFKYCKNNRSLYRKRYNTKNGNKKIILIGVFIS
jgi:hypothetical protein